MDPHIEDMVIVGTGPAGLTAAIYGARAGLSPLIFAGNQPGGQLTTTTDVENFPGFADGILGPQLMENMTTQAQRVGARIEHHHIEAVGYPNPETSADQQQRLKQLHLADGGITLAKSVILCTGATAKTLQLSGEDELIGHGLSTCATCDGFFYRDKVVAVVGGGDSAMEESLFLANLAQKVYLIHRRDSYRASHIMLERAEQHPNIEFLVPYQVHELLKITHDSIATPSLSGVRLRHTLSGDLRQLDIDGLFYAIGHTPNSGPFAPWVDTDTQGYVIVTGEVQTKTPGVYAAGDVCDPHFKQAITAAGLGCKAAMSAIRYLDETSW